MGRRRAPTFTAVDDQLVGSGIQPDRHSIKRLLWESSANVVFWNGTVRRKIPPAEAYDTGTGDPIRGLMQLYNVDGGRWLWSGAGGDIYRWQFGAPELVGTMPNYIADTTATERATIYDFTPYGNWMIVNSGDPDNPAKIFKPGTPDTFDTFAAGEAPEGVVKFMKKMSFIIALGYGQRGTRVGWSDSNDIELWTPAAENTAGALSIDEFNTPIRTGAGLGDAIAVYSEDQMALLRYIGSPFVFGQKTVIDGIGAVGKAAVATDTKINVGFSRAGAWWTDGSSARYIDEGYISNYFQDNVNWAQAAKIVVSRNDETGCFEFHLPMGASNVINEAWSWDPRNGGWSPIPAYSFADERRLFDHVIYGSETGEVLLADYDPTAAATLELETKPLVMQTEASPHTVVRIDEVDLLLHEADGIEFRVGCSEEPNAPELEWDWTEWMPAEAGAKVYNLPHLPEQPFWKLALRSTPGQANWQLDLQGFLLYGMSTGTKQGGQ